MSKRKHIPASFGHNIKGARTPSYSDKLQAKSNETPVWEIRTLVMDGPFGWKNMEGIHFWTNVFPKMKNFESMKWTEILGRNSHAVRVADISKEAYRLLQEMKMEDTEELVSLRLEGRERVWGIRDDRVFQILWWDPQHLVYPCKDR